MNDNDGTKRTKMKEIIMTSIILEVDGFLARLHPDRDEMVELLSKIARLMGFEIDKPWFFKEEHWRIKSE